MKNKNFFVKLLFGTSLAFLFLCLYTNVATGESDECKAFRAMDTAKKPGSLRPSRTRAEIPEIQPDGSTLEEAASRTATARRNSDDCQMKLEETNDEITRIKTDLDNAKKAKPQQASVIDSLERTLQTLYESSGTIASRCEFLDKEFLKARKNLEDRLDLLALQKWEAWDKIVSDYEAAETAMQKEFDAVQAIFDSEKEGFQSEAQALKNQSASDPNTMQKARELKQRTTTALEKLKTRLAKYDCWPDVGEYIKNPIESTIFKLNKWKVSASGSSDLPEEDFPENDLDLPGIGDTADTGDVQLEDIPEDLEMDDAAGTNSNQTPPNANQPDTIPGASPCSAADSQAFSQMTGSWTWYRMNVTIGGSCENATGGFDVREWCEGVNEPDVDKNNNPIPRAPKVHGTFQGRMQGGSLQVNWDQPASPNHPAAKGTGSCSPGSDGISCSGFGCSGELKKQ